jgi:hypothetical protein
MTESTTTRPPATDAGHVTRLADSMDGPAKVHKDFHMMHQRWVHSIPKDRNVAQLGINRFFLNLRIIRIFWVIFKSPHRRRGRGGWGICIKSLHRSQKYINVNPLLKN